MTVRSDKWIFENFNKNVLYTVRKSATALEGETMGLKYFQDWYAGILASGGKPISDWADAFAVNEFLVQLHVSDAPQWISIDDYFVSIAKDSPRAMIYPFTPESINTFPDGRKIPSYGLSSYGYDIRLGRSFKVFSEAAKPFIGDMGNMTAVYHSSPFYTQTYEEIDILNFPKNIGVDFNDVDSVVIPPRGFALGVAMEYLDIPDDKVVICMAKSTLARMALDMSVTPVEPGWKGYLTLEITNKTAFPMRVHSGVGAMQLMILDGDEECLVSYAIRQGKYQNQPAIPVGPRL